jgi:hypothetical protein
MRGCSRAVADGGPMLLEGRHLAGAAIGQDVSPFINPDPCICRMIGWRVGAAPVCRLRSWASQLLALLIGAVVVLYPCQSSGQMGEDSGFDFVSQAIDAVKRREVFPAWNPDNRSGVLSPGFKVMFFGEGAGCRRNTANGPVTSIGNPYFDQALEMSGIPLATDAAGQRWTPSADIRECAEVSDRPVGDSFVHLNTDGSSAAIGLVTVAGDPLADAGRSFFRPFGAPGRNGRGVNRHIESTFVNFRFDWRREDVIRPWLAEEGVALETAVELRTVQSVAAFNVGAMAVQSGDLPVQAKQQLMMTVMNRYCFREMRSASRLCQVQYLFNLALYRSGVADWDAIPWAKSAGVFLDPAQGGMPVVHGLLDAGDTGESVSRTPAGLPLYFSLGAASQHDSFFDREFIVRITFEQFTDALFEIAAKTFKKAAADLSHDDVRALYGSRWDDPSQWVLLSLHVGQEVYNPGEDGDGFIGGNVRELSVVGVLHRPPAGTRPKKGGH